MSPQDGEVRAQFEKFMIEKRGHFPESFQARFNGKYIDALMEAVQCLPESAKEWPKP